MRHETDFSGLLLVMFAALSSAASADGSYTEGPVSRVTSIRVHAGYMDQYAAYLAGTWKTEQEALEKAGVILNYAVYATMPRHADDPNLYLVASFPNMAALDGLDDRSEAVLVKATGVSNEASAKAMIERNAMRTVIGQELIRELKLK